MSDGASDFYQLWRKSFDACRFEMAKLIFSEPVGDYTEFSDEVELPDAALHFDFSPLQVALGELAELTERSLYQVENPYRHEETLVEDAAGYLRDLIRGGDGLSAVMGALLGSKAAVEYMLRYGREDVASYYMNGPFEWCPDQDDLPSGWKLEECSWCSQWFPTDKFDEDDAWPWCSETCFELTTE